MDQPTQTAFDIRTANVRAYDLFLKYLCPIFRAAIPGAGLGPGKGAEGELMLSLVNNVALTTYFS